MRWLGMKDPGHDLQVILYGEVDIFQRDWELRRGG